VLILALRRTSNRITLVAPLCSAVLLASLVTTVAVTSVDAQTCPSCTPLDDVSGPPHRGVWLLGLYPGSSNAPPPAHAALATSAAANIVPRNASGAPSAAGWIGMLSIGMSNTNQEFATFERIADSDLARNARIIVVDGAVGGQSADVIVDPTDPYWDIVDDRVRVAGLDPDQIQVVWLKQAEGAVPDTSFPAHAETLQAHVRNIVTHLKDRFPNLRICFLSSRIYGGYGSNPARTEPLSFEGGLAMRWVLEDQIAGDPGLNPDPGMGLVEAPVLLWGPYLWANGATPRASDGLTWLPADYESDFIHPAPGGEAKVAALLDGFFTTNPYAVPWYLDDPGADLDTVGTVADAYVEAANPSTNYGAATVLRWGSGVRAYVKFDLTSVVGTVVHAKLAMKVPAYIATRPTEVVGVSNTTWNEAAITAATAPAFDLAVIDTIPQASSGTAVGVDVTAEVLTALTLPPGSRRMTLGLRAIPGHLVIQEVLSRESLEGPWLVLTTVRSAVGVEPSSIGAPQPIALEVRPNPSRGAAEISLALSRNIATASVEIFDLNGRRVRVLHLGPLSAGSHRLSWDGRDAVGRSAASGIYWVRTRGDGLQVGRMLVRLP
jgi:FlgD Ig-like domain